MFDIPADMPANAESVRHRVRPLIAGGRVRPVSHSTCALAHAGAAHALMETSNHLGKAMLRVGEEPV